MTIKRKTHNRFACNAGTFLKSKVKTVTNPKAPAANHSGTATFQNHVEEFDKLDLKGYPTPKKIDDNNNNNLPVVSGCKVFLGTTTATGLSSSGLIRRKNL